MGQERWTFSTIWAAFRDVASWGLGAFWGNQQMTSPTPGDPVKIALVATLLGLPFAFRADELRQLRKSRHDQQPSGNHSQSSTESVVQ